MLTKEQRITVAQLYNSGISSAKIAADFRTTISTVLKWTNKAGFTIKNKSDARRQYKLDEAAFDMLTEESIYWLGFLMGDGSINISEKKQYKLSVDLSIIDERHLMKFRDFLKSDYKFDYLPAQLCMGKNGKEYWSKPHVRLIVTSQRLVTKLIEYGIIPNKAFVTIAPDVLSVSRHFWRGLIDADGCLDTFNNPPNVSYPRLRLCGSHSLMTQFLEFVKGQVPYRCEVSILPHDKSFNIGIGGKNAIFLMEYLYKDTSIYLDRKQKAMIDIINNNRELV